MPGGPETVNVENAPLIREGNGYCWNSLMHYTMKEPSMNAISVWMTTQVTWILVHDPANSHDRWSPQVWSENRITCLGLTRANNSYTSHNVYPISVVIWVGCSKLGQRHFAAIQAAVQTDEGKESISASGERTFSKIHTSEI